MEKQIAERELARFLSIASSTNLFMEMFSPLVDQEWHDKLEDGSYEEWCKRNDVPAMVHAETSGQGAIPWVAEYHSKFGQLPDLWFRDNTGKLDETLWRDYLNGKEIRACWDCHPLPVEVIIPAGGGKSKGGGEKPKGGERPKE